MCLCNKGFGFNTSHTPRFYDIRAACVQNNKPFTLPATHVFQKKMVAASGTFHQVDSNNGVGTQSLPPINDGTYPDPVGGLHHMDASALDSQYAVQKTSVCEHSQNSVSDSELSLFIAYLQKAWNLN